LIVNSAFSATSARVIALRIENPDSILRQIANLPQQGKMIAKIYFDRMKKGYIFAVTFLPRFP
jgi:hypothetical protein